MEKKDPEDPFPASHSMAGKEGKMRAKKLRFIGLDYAGFDPVLKQPISAVRGDVVEVSPEKAKQLGEDFPDDWQDASEPFGEEDQGQNEPPGG